MEVNSCERKAIASLKRVARKWPKTLWLFSGSGMLYVMKKGSDGNTVMTNLGGVDQEYIVDRIAGISNDGGDWD